MRGTYSGIAARNLNLPVTAQSAGGRAGGYRGAAEKHLQSLMGQAAWMTACKQMPPKARGPLLKNIGLYEAGHIYSLPRVHQ
jgi:hypothetical protein